eukprot:CFRG7325T1
MEPSSLSDSTRTCESDKEVKNTVQVESSSYVALAPPVENPSQTTTPGTTNTRREEKLSTSSGQAQKQTHISPPDRRLANRVTEQKRRDSFKASIEDLRLEVTRQMEFESRLFDDKEKSGHPQSFTKAEVIREAVVCLKRLQEKYSLIQQQKKELLSERRKKNE